MIALTQKMPGHEGPGKFEGSRADRDCLQFISPQEFHE
jgi:hypothetical protein